MKVIMIGTVIWGVACLCAIGAITYAMYYIITGDSLIELERGRLVALDVGFLPWVLAYAATRVMYGIETLLEE